MARAQGLPRQVPFPVILLDTGNEFPEVYAFRDRLLAEWSLDYINAECPPAGETDASLPPAARAARKTLGLKRLIAARQFRGILLGIRRDEQAIRGKERVFSPRRADGSWDFRDQPAEFWDQYQTDFPAEFTCVSTRCSRGPSSTSGATSSAKAFRCASCTSPGTASASVRWARVTSRIR